MKLTDPVTDRPITPYGLLVYCTTGEQILTSSYSPISRFLKTNMGFTGISEGREGYVYIGLVCIAAFFCSLVMGIINVRNKKSAQSIVGNKGFSPIWLFIAFASLLLGMGVPFMWHMEWIINYASFLRQFRTLGRFSWIFYYIITIYCVVVIYAWHTKLLFGKKRVAAYLLLIVAFSLWACEASGYITYERDELKKSRVNYDMLFTQKDHDWKQFLRQNHYAPNDFQALLTLGFIEVGSDKLWLGNEDAVMALSYGFVAGLQLHLPIIDAMMARSSWSVAEKQVKIVAGPYVTKPMLYGLPDNRPFLLLFTDNTTLNPDEQYLISASDSIGHFNGAHVYACYPARILANDKQHAGSIRALVASLQVADTCIHGNGSWYINHFDACGSSRKFFGTGALPQVLKQGTAILNIPVTPAYNGQPYEFSCWFLLGDKNYRSPYFKLEMTDAKGGIIGSSDVMAKASTDNLGLWFRASQYFNVPQGCNSIRCILYNDPGNSYQVMDEVLLRPANALIISKAADGSIMVNNHLFTMAPHH